MSRQVSDDDVDPNDTFEPGQPDDTVDAPEHDLQSDELPSDPEALKELLLANQEKLKAATKETKKAQREVERQADRVKEQKTKADYWAREAQRKQGEASPANPSSTAQPSAKAQTPTSDVKNILAGMDLADYVTEDDGLAKLVSDLEAKGALVTTARLEQILSTRLDERVDTERQQNIQYQEVLNRFPDLADSESELAQEATAEYEDIIAKNPNLAGAIGFELAASRAAQALGIAQAAPGRAQSGTRHPQPAQPGQRSNRVARAQGGPTGRQPATARPIVITDDLRKRAAKTAGGPVDEKVLQRVMATVARNQKQNPNTRQ
jgi:hypothetical protein